MYTIQKSTEDHTREYDVLLANQTDSKGHVCVLLSCFSHFQLSATQWTATCQAPLSAGFSRQEYWSESPCPPPGIFPTQELKPKSLTSPALAGGFFTTSISWEVIRPPAFKRREVTAHVMKRRHYKQIKDSETFKILL